MRIIMLGFCLFSATLAVVSCGEDEAGGKKASDLFPEEQAAALARAASEGDIATIDQAVADGVDANVVGVEDATPLLWAIGSQNEAGLRRLLDRAIDPNRPTGSDQSPALRAAPR